MHFFKKVIYALAVIILSGCATVDLEDSSKDLAAKEFNLPTEGQSGLYIFRKFGPGTALKKDIRINGKCIGESAPSIYFYNELAGDTEHEISTESEFSPNKIYLPMLGGQNYFVENYITMGAFVGGANLRVIDESKGKAAVLKLKLAKQGNCMSAQ
ncbi:MAG: DUF2846 domain-containing protein [Amylibacter sp.]|nr:DUF2846 domain-containing protein [Amylibacter sp.]